MDTQSHIQNLQDATTVSRRLRPHRHLLRTVLRKMLLACSSVSWLNLAVFVVYAAYVRQGLGHWPKPMVDLAPLPYAHLFDNLSNDTFFGVVLSVPLWLVLSLIGLARQEKKGVLQAGILFWSGIGATLLAFLLDKGHFFAWWLD